VRAREKKKLAEICLRGGKAYCDLYEEFDCEYIRFALSLPKVVEPLKEKGWPSGTER
jgi:hypothetical protein